MTKRRVYQAALVDLEQDLDGLIGAAFIDLASGEILASHSVEPAFDQGAVGNAGREAIVVQGDLVPKGGARSIVEEMTVTMTDRIHVYSVVGPGVFLSVSAERSETTLAWVKAIVGRCIERLTDRGATERDGTAAPFQQRSTG